MKPYINKLIIATLLSLSASTMNATDWKDMVITMNDNSISDIVLSLSETPTIEICGDSLKIMSSQVEIYTTNIKDIHYTDGTYNSITDLNGKSGVEVSPHITSRYVNVTGINGNSVIKVFSSNGAECKAAISRNDTSARVDVGSLSKGIYMLQVNKETIKIIKK